MGNNCMTVHKDPPVYRTYLFTIWEEQSAQSATEPVWRFRLEDPRSGQKYLFVALDDLMQFLELKVCPPHR